MTFRRAMTTVLMRPTKVSGGVGRAQFRNSQYCYLRRPLSTSSSTEGEANGADAGAADAEDEQDMLMAYER